MTKLLISLSVVTAIFHNVNSGAHWNYPDRENNASDPKWGGACDDGKKQSPIDLRKTESFQGVFQHFIFLNYEKTLKGTVISNTGHSVQVNTLKDKQFKVSGGGLPGVYVFEQMHWHWWSEHRVDGLRYPLEVHLVSRNEIYPNMSTAVEHRYGVSVIGVLFHLTDTSNSALSNVLVNLQNIEDDVGKATELYEDVRPEDFLPSDKRKYFRYEGSLTTPGCDESVIWTVFEKTIPVTLDQVEKFTQVKDTNGNSLKSNYRSIQSGNNRAVTYITDNYGKTGKGFRSSIPVLLTVAMSVMLCIFI